MESNRIVSSIIQHVPFEGPGIIHDYIINNLGPYNLVKPFTGMSFPEPEDYELLVIMGGPMGVYDETSFPWLFEEKRCIGKAIFNNKPVLGICLGAQMIATVMGAEVRKNREKEIGWYPVSRETGIKSSPYYPLLPESFNVFHWHGDTFDIPSGATRILKNQVCENQGFIYKDTVIGLQCHLEMRDNHIRELIKACADDITPGPFVQEPDEIIARSKRFENEANDVMLKILEKLHDSIRKTR